MKILVERRKADFFMEAIEEYPTDNYLEAIRMALEKHSAAGYAVSKVSNIEPTERFNEIIERCEHDPHN